MIKLDEFNINQQSNYLDNGFTHDKMALKNISVDLEGRLIYANLRIISSYSPDYKKQLITPHLSDLTAYRALGQLLIGYNCLKSGLKKQDLGELWQMSYSTNNRKLIPLNKEIKLTAECKKWITRGKLIYQNWHFEIENKSFYGEVRCAVSNYEGLSK